MGSLDKIRQVLIELKQLFNTDVRDLFKSQGRLVEEAFLGELRMVLMKTDMGMAASQAIVDEVRKNSRGRMMQMDNLEASIKRIVRKLLVGHEKT